MVHSSYGEPGPWRFEVNPRFFINTAHGQILLPDRSRTAYLDNNNMPAHRGYQRKCHPPHRYLLPCRVHHNNNPVEVGVGGNTWDPEGAVRSQVDSTLAAEERLRNELREEEIECMELARAWGREDPGRDRRLDGQVADMKGGSPAQESRKSALLDQVLSLSRSEGHIRALLLRVFISSDCARKRFTYVFATHCGG
jgi:hypothetical protein